MSDLVSELILKTPSSTDLVRVPLPLSIMVEANKTLVLNSFENYKEPYIKEDNSKFFTNKGNENPQNTPTNKYKSIPEPI